MLKVDSVCMNSHADVLYKLADRLENISAEVSSVTRNLNWNSKVSLTVRASLQIQKQMISQLDNKTRNLAMTLKEISEEYEKAEKVCASNDYTKDTNGIPSIAELIDIDQFLLMFISAVICGPQSILIGIPALGKLIGVIGSAASGSDGSSPSDRTWFGYDTSEDWTFTGWGGKADARAESDWGYAGVNGYLGKVEAKADADFSFMKFGKKWKEEDFASVINAELGASASVNILAGDAEAGIGDGMLGLEGKGNVSIGNAKAEAKGQFAIDKKGVDAYAKGEAMLSAAEGEVEGSFNLLGFEITGKIGGYAGALGAEGKIGVEDSKFVMDAGLAAGFGLSAGVEIGFNEEGWDEFVDFITFWD